MSRPTDIAKDLSRIQTALDRQNLRRALPLLAQVRIASPCDQRWSDMALGADDRTRHCSACKCDVHDISAMTSEAAEEFLRQRVGTDTCVRLYQRADGTILTREDCSVGASRKRRRRVAVAIAVAGTAALTTALAPAPQECATRTWSASIAKHAAVELIPPAAPETFESSATRGVHMAGGLRPMPPPRKSAR